MGERQNIRIEDNFDAPPLFLYAHWGGGGPLAYDLATALNSKAGRNRWTDGAYLARIIFCELVGDDLAGETGYGISTYRPDENYPDLVVNIKNQTVDGVPFEEFIAATLKADT